MSLENKISPLSEDEKNQVGRKILAWLNTFPDLPENIYGGIILYEQLIDKSVCMSMSTIQGTYITDEDILGRRDAEYQFKIVYRVQPGPSLDKRLAADELLDALGGWANGQKPDIGERKQVLEMIPATQSAVANANASGDEDHQILMRMVYQIGL